MFIIQFIKFLEHSLTRFTWAVWFSLIPADVPEEHLVAGHVGARLVVSGVVLWLAGYHCGF